MFFSLNQQWRNSIPEGHDKFNENSAQGYFLVSLVFIISIFCIHKHTFTELAQILG